MEQNYITIREIEDGIVFGAKVVPGSSKTDICGVLDGMLKFKVSAAPEKGKANRSLIDFIAKRLGVKKKQISIIAGQTSKIKQIRVLSISAETFLQKIGLSN